METSCLCPAGRTGRENKDQNLLFTLSTPCFIDHQTQTGVCSKETLDKSKHAKLAKSNAESAAELHELPCTAMQTALVFCYSN